MLWLVVGASVALGCEIIAGLDKDYVLGPGGGPATGTTSTGTTATGGGTGGAATGVGLGGEGTGGATGGSGTGTETGTATGTGTGTGTGTATGTVTGTGTGTGTGTVASIPCGGQTCTGGQVCCVQPYGNFQGCGAPGSCGLGEFEIECDGAEDCAPNESCCCYWTGQYSWIRCEATCDGFYEYIMCGGDGAPNPQYCINGGTCNSDGNLPPYWWCG
jgi:hypothetical protein